MLCLLTLNETKDVKAVIFKMSGLVALVTPGYCGNSNKGAVIQEKLIVTLQIKVY